ncbi:peptide/nickel transport system permease protein [Kribbella orskensis]|uniref:Peptide/nickel transport system permease protein n=1 Tax=Kribbella orskensis TaxID=2512216 RepID=A0ABY2BP01_9ACTN|nr:MULTISPECIES: ABC transporter permease [Kribbella]TCN40756.1 peptide/nickel transport system permease protein [Kribbella sp. VKM Ac-2500]TCO24008.1 peptide/nickel transport system permease protein [Kribbella orskensis]
MTITHAVRPVSSSGSPGPGQLPRNLWPLFRFGFVRIGQSVLTLAVLVPATFLLFRAVPGDPAAAVIGPDVDPAVAEQLRQRYGLDDPLPMQFQSYCQALLHGDLGMSFQYKVPVTDVLGEALINTAVLVVPAIILAVLIGVWLGAFAATSRPRVDGGLRTSAFVVKASPVFWVSTLALMLFGLILGLVPSIGMFSPGRADGGTFWSWDFLHHLLLPLSILVMYYLVEPMLTMRTAMNDVLGQEFIAHGKAQGLAASRIIYRHGARNAMLPVVTLAPTLVDNVIGGQVIVETVFSWPGMGRAVVEAVNNFDYPVMQGVFLLTAVTVVAVNATVDVMYAYLDPRVRLA